MSDGQDTSRMSSGVVIALTRGWPDAEALKQYYDFVKRERRGVALPVFMHLAARFYPVEQLMNMLASYIIDRQANLLYAFRESFDAFVQRLRSDPEWVREIVEMLCNAKRASTKITCISLLEEGGGMPSRVESWAVEELKRQMSSGVCSEFGLNLCTGSTEPIVPRLMRIIKSDA